MRPFLVHQLSILSVVCLLALFDTWQTSISIALGGLLMSLNLLILGTAWIMIGRKKLIALSVLVIVSKYTFLAVVLYQILSLSWVRPVPFMIGVSLFVFSTVVTGLLLQKKSQQARPKGRKEEWLLP